MKLQAIRNQEKLFRLKRDENEIFETIKLSNASKRETIVGVQHRYCCCTQPEAV